MDERVGRRHAINGVVIDLDRDRVIDVAGSAVELRPQTFEVLRYLIENPDRLISKGELMSAVWPDVAVTDDSLVQCVHEIRRALNDEQRAILRTVFRRGYRLKLPRADEPALTVATRTPAIITPRASGSSTWSNNWRSVMPMPRPASRIAGSTLLMPVKVLRIIGKSAYNTNATIAVRAPMPPTILT